MRHILPIMMLWLFTLQRTFISSRISWFSLTRPTSWSTLVPCSSVIAFNFSSLSFRLVYGEREKGQSGMLVVWYVSFTTITYAVTLVSRSLMDSCSVLFSSWSLFTSCLNMFWTRRSAVREETECELTCCWHPEFYTTHATHCPYLAGPSAA